jgi:hypothetical protein
MFRRGNGLLALSLLFGHGQCAAIDPFWATEYISASGNGGLAGMGMLVPPGNPAECSTK